MKFGEVISWYYRRFRVMSLREILHRLQERCFLLELRFGVGAADTQQLNRVARTCSFCRATSSQLPVLTWKFDPSSGERAGILAGRSAALGYDWSWRADPAVWHTAPDTGNQWPRNLFFASIGFRAGNPYGDARVVWEPSRLQQLVSLALLASDTASASERRQAVGLLRRVLISWQAANPPYRGIHYVSAMECGLRIISVCHAMDMARPFIQRDDELWSTLVQIVASHAALIVRRLSLYSSAGNHTIAESAGLVYAGILFPELKGAAKWRETGLAVFSREIDRQILEDGGGIESALWYHLFVTELCGLVVSLLEMKNGDPAGKLKKHYNKAARFLGTLADTADELPKIGDCDNGYSLSRFLWTTWRGQSSGRLLETFRESGISVIKDPQSAIRLCFDHGPLGMAPCCGHGHADSLSVSLVCKGERVLDGAGTFTYTGGSSWRRYFRGTRAHNTVCVDGDDQAVQRGPFIWSEPYTSTLLLDRAEPGAAFLLACHDGYLHSKGVIHWRGLVYKVGGWILVWDRLAGEGQHVLELNWHTPMGVIRRRDGFHLRNGISLYVAGGETGLVTGDSTTKLGWMSDNYGVKYPGVTVNSSYTGTLPHEFTTSIVLSGDAPDRGTVLQAVAQFRDIVSEAGKN